MEGMDIFQVIDAVGASTKQLEMKDNQKEVYLKKYELIRLYCIENNLKEFDDYHALEFYCSNNAGLKVLEDRALKKAAFTVAKYWKTGTFDWGYVTLNHYPVNKEHQSLLDQYQNHLLESIGVGTTRVEMVIVRQYLHYMEHDNENDRSLATNDTIVAYIQRESVNHKGSMSILLRAMRKFSEFLNAEGLANVDIRRLPNKSAKTRRKQLPCFTEAEIVLIFEQIDRDTTYGKRNYAIFLIALRLGTRASDIAKLRLDEIDWNNSQIRITQQKTKKAVCLPLPIDVGNAIADYILHGREKNENPYVFQRVTMPSLVEPINPSQFNAVLQRYMQAAGMKKSGWDGKTFHALRRTAGTNMVTTGTPVTTVAQVLGHSNIDSTKRYIALDTEGMRVCCLSLKDMASRKEGL